MAPPAFFKLLLSFCHFNVKKRSNLVLNRKWNDGILECWMNGFEETEIWDGMSTKGGGTTNY
jgi:hypothetical protein